MAFFSEQANVIDANPFEVSAYPNKDTKAL